MVHENFILLMCVYNLNLESQYIKSVNTGFLVTTWELLTITYASTFLFLLRDVELVELFLHDSVFVCEVNFS